MATKKPEFTVKEIFPRIFHLKYKTQKAMTRAMVRFSEHYEHPEFRGEVFTVREFKAWTKKKGNEFTYFTDVYGFNFPSEILEAFRDGSFDPLSRGERDVVNAFEGNTNRFYVIATYKDGDIAHEVSHGLYYTNSKYRKKVKEILADQAKTGGMGDWEKAIRNMGYHEAVVADEIHAYLMETQDYLKKTFVGEKFIPKLGRFTQTRKRLWDAYNLEIGS